MLKNEWLEEIEEARKAHLRWVKRVKNLVEEIFILDEMIDLDPEDSEFGRWISRDCTCRNTLFFEEVFDKIEEQHINVHQIYFQIYGIYFVETQRKAFAAFLLGPRKSLSDEQHAEAKEYYYELIKSSEKLLVQMNNLERKINISSDAFIEECMVKERDHCI